MEQITFDFPAAGALVAITGVVLLFADPRYLLYLTVFFVPFSALSVINVHGFNGRVWALPAPFFLSLLFNFLAVARLRLYTDTESFKHPLFIYLITTVSAVMVSWIGPFFFSSELESCKAVNPWKFECKQTSFNLTFLTQALYLFNWIHFAWAFSSFVNRRSLLRETLTAVMYSCAFVSLWGVLQILLYYSGVDYPQYIFNTSAILSAQGHSGLYEGINLRRLSSVAVEPSIFAQNIALMIPMLIGAKSLWPHWMWSAVAFIGSVALAATATKTSLAALVVIGTLIIFVAIHEKWSVKKVAMAILPMVAGFTFYSVSNSSYPMYLSYIASGNEGLLFEQDAFGSMLKEGFSTFERGNSLKQALAVWKQSPWVGVGWRTVTSHDLVVNLLANTGVLGLLCVGAVFVMVLYSLSKSIKRLKLSGQQDMGYFLLIAAIATTLIQQLAGFSFVFGHVWLLIGVSYAFLRCSVKVVEAR